MGRLPRVVESTGIVYGHGPDTEALWVLRYRPAVMAPARVRIEAAVNGETEAMVRTRFARERVDVELDTLVRVEVPR